MIKKMKRILKRILLAFIILVLLLQFYPRAKDNIAGAETKHLSKTLPIADVEQILKVSCYDCHSNNTIYPW